MARLLRGGPLTNAFNPRGNDGSTLNFKKVENIAELTERFGSSTAITIEVETGGGGQSGQGGGGGIILHLAPTITDVTDSAGTITDDSFTTETSLTFSGGGTAGETIQLLNGGSPIGASYTIPQGVNTWSITLNGLSYASYDITAQGDLGGDIKTSTAVTFLVEQALVAGTITEASDSQTAITASGRLGETSITLTGTADPNATSHTLVDSADNTITGITVAPDGSFSFSITTAYEATYSYAVRSTTANQDVIGSDFVVTIDFYMVAPTIDSIFDGTQTLAAGSTVDVADFDVVGTAEAGSTVTLSDGISTLGTTTADAQGDWTVSLTGQVDGAYTFDATATAANGDTETSANFGFTVSITPTQSWPGHDVFADPTFTKTLKEVQVGSMSEAGSATSYDGTTLLLDGMGDYLEVDNDSRFNPGGGDWSISMDLKSNTKTTNNPGTIFSKMDEYNADVKSEGLSFTYNAAPTSSTRNYTDAFLRLQHADDTDEDGINDYTGNFVQLVGSNTLTDIDQWHKLSVVYDNTNGEVRFYKNGTLFETFTGYSVPGDTTAHTRIGAHSFWADTNSGAMNYTFAGLIENVHVYNGAWTENDIRNLPVRPDIPMPAPTP